MLHYCYGNDFCRSTFITHTRMKYGMCVHVCLHFVVHIREKRIYHKTCERSKWYYAVSWWFRRLSEARIENTSVNEVTNEKQTKKSLIIIAVATTTTTTAPHQIIRNWLLASWMEEEVWERNKLCWWQNDDDKLKLTVAWNEVSAWTKRETRD